MADVPGPPEDGLELSPDHQPEARCGWRDATLADADSTPSAPAVPIDTSCSSKGAER